MECQSLVKQQDCSDQLNQNEKQGHHVKMERKVEDPVKKLLRQRKWYADIRATRPWIAHWYSMMSRCHWNKGHWYFLHGIKCLLTKEDVQFLWNRDSAFLMKSPTVDRKDSSMDYIMDNCRFIERVDNNKNKKIGWSYVCSECISCGTNKVKHQGHGLCKNCYKSAWKKRVK